MNTITVFDQLESLAMDLRKQTTTKETVEIWSWVAVYPDGTIYKNGKAGIGQTGQEVASAFDFDDLETAITKCAQAWKDLGSPEARRAAEVAKLEVQAEKLGYLLVESEPKTEVA